MWRDLVYAMRQLRRSPGLTAAALLTLALGIGANSAVFQVLDAVAFRPLPVRAPDELVHLQLVSNDRPVTFSYPLYRDLASRQTVAQGLFAISDYPLHAAVLRGRGPARTINAALVSGGYFPLLGLTARAGRLLTQDDDRGSSPPVAVISHSFWDREFGMRLDVLGAPLQINNLSVTIVGVAPPQFLGETQGNAPDAWVPLSLAPVAMATDWLKAPNAAWINVFARLQPDIGARQARESLEALLRQVGPDRQARLELRPANRGITQLQIRFGQPLIIMISIVSMVLLMACCNLANLLLSKSAARESEIAITLALGAGRGRVAARLLTESLLLAGGGFILSLLVAQWGARTLVALATRHREWQLALGLDWRVLAFTGLVTLLATCLFGLAPALASTRVDLNLALQRGGRTVGAGWRRPLGRILIVAQVSLSLILLSGAALLLRSLWSLRHQDFGFTSDHVLMAQLPWEFNPRMMARYASIREPLYERINRLPGVRAAALAGFGPMGGDQHTGRLASPERPAQPGDNPRIVHVSPRYFEAMGIGLVAGRSLNAEDCANCPKAAVLSATAARILFEGATAVGRRISPSDRYDAGDSLIVVGVARDVRFAGPSEPFGSLIYLPLTQAPAPITAIVLRTQGEPAAAAAALREAVQAVDPNLALGSIRPLRETIDVFLSSERLVATLGACVGALSLILMCVGVYGVVSYAVKRRTREIGVRLALGATRAQLTRDLMREVASLTAASTALGGVGTIAITRALRGFLFGFGNHDYLLIALIAAFLGMVALTAALIPVHRAGKLDPMTALRQ